MDTCVLISVLSVMCSWMLCTVLCAPAAPTTTASPPTRGLHVRTKRCSCATFLDKECVYFCHLDIIWVNTPERLVSYGLGDAPRTRRAAPGSMATGSGPRCRCAREDDSTCGSFCRADNGVRSETSTDAAGGDGCAEARRRREQAADADGTRRTESSNMEQVSPVLLKAALKTRLLLEKWRVRQHHRARAREGVSTAS